MREIIVALFLAGAALGQNPRYEQDPRWNAPANAAIRQNPLSEKPETAAGGRKLFLRNCAECHGPDGTGMAAKHSADLQLAAVQEQTDGTLFWKMSNGNASRGMPSFSKLPELQRWQLVLYIRTLKTAQNSGGNNGDQTVTASGNSK